MTISIKCGKNLYFCLIKQNLFNVLNKEDFFRLITRPDELTAMHLLEIEEASLNFPYCQLIHFILAKAYYEQSSPEALLIVKKAAIYATQREGLKIFLHTNSTIAYELPSPGTQKDIEPTLEEFISPANVTPPVIEIINEKKTSTIDLKKFESTLLPPHHFEIVNPNTNINTNSVADDVLSGLKKLKNFTDHIDEPPVAKKVVQPTENIEKIVPKFNFEDVLKVVENDKEVKKEQEDQKIFPAFSTGIDKTIADDVLAGLQKLKKFTVDNESLVSASLSETHYKLEAKVENTEQSNDIQLPVNILEPQTFTEHIVNTIKAPENIEVNTTVEDNDKPFVLGRLNENDKDIVAFIERMRIERKEKEKEIIENFITNEPRMNVPSLNQDDTSAIKDLSNNFNNSNVVLASENLANIMIKQGKINSAIEILHKLILKYPEKSTYFATRIDELKKISTDNQL